MNKTPTSSLHFYPPKGWVGRVICMVTGERFSHVALRMGSAQVELPVWSEPTGYMLPQNVQEHARPSTSTPISLTQEQIWSIGECLVYAGTCGARHQTLRTLWWGVKRRLGFDPGPPPFNCVTFITSLLMAAGVELVSTTPETLYDELNDQRHANLLQGSDRVLEGDHPAPALGAGDDS